MRIFNEKKFGNGWEKFSLWLFNFTCRKNVHRDLSRELWASIQFCYFHVGGGGIFCGSSFFVMGLFKGKTYDLLKNIEEKIFPEEDGIPFIIWNTMQRWIKNMFLKIKVKKMFN